MPQSPNTATARLALSGLPRVGEIVDGKYRVDAFIGRGNIGVVARARHLTRDADVALKFLRAEHALTAAAGGSSASAAIADRFRQEAVAASRLSTDHVVHIYDTGETSQGVPYLVMEYLRGEDLESVLHREKRLSTARTLHIVLQACRALSVAHRAGVVHRDLKPGNLFLTERDGELDFVKILDFGISKVDKGASELRLTAGEIGMGTPLYMAPEQARDARTATPAADIYSLASVLYECVAGVPPIEATSTADLFYKLVHDVPKRLDALFDVPPGLADAVAKALSKSPEERPASAEAFATLLAPFTDERSDRALASLRVPSSSSIPVPGSGRPAAPSLGGTHYGHDVPDPDADTYTPVPKARWGIGAGLAFIAVAFTAGLYFAQRGPEPRGFARTEPAVVTAQASAPAASAAVPPASVVTPAPSALPPPVPVPALPAPGTSARPPASDEGKPVPVPFRKGGKKGAAAADDPEYGYGIDSPYGEARPPKKGAIPPKKGEPKSDDPRVPEPPKTIGPISPTPGPAPRVNPAQDPGLD